ncbi:MAG TPA: response regulator transcription factor [Beijerinckiaceae bacterium]|nr:response regulator transcription factor [Beijerinckiaceae bacterium]
MYVLVDERQPVVKGYSSGFGREGVPLAGFDPVDFADWLRTAQDADLNAVEGFLLGDCKTKTALPQIIRERSSAPVIAMSDAHCLATTLQMFAAGVDDVVRKPVHVRELLARADAIRRRVETPCDHVAIGDLKIYFDGRDPSVEDEVLELPRRERRILQHLALNKGRRVTKAQIFNAIYGIFDSDVKETVIESHISKLRRKLTKRLGFDPIDSKRFLGYMLA